MRVDFGRLLLLDGIIVVAGGLLAWAVSDKSAARQTAVRLVFYALLGACFAAVVCLAVASAVVIRNARKTNEDWFAKNAPTWDNTTAVAPPKSAVSADDLRKITLFDVAPVLSFGDSSHLSAFHGRVRNDLSRAVEKIGLRASFYTTRGELIEVRTFWMLGPDWQNLASVLPNSPVSFHGRVDVENLPVGWTYRLEVIETHYVPDIFDSIDTTNK
jgi:hypothetical protein